MVGRLLSIDLRDEGIIVSTVHPGFMRTEMTAGVGFDQYWESGGAVHPDEAAESIAEWAKEVDMEKTGEYWAPRGPGMFCDALIREKMLTVSRGYWNGRCNDRNGITYSFASTMVDSI